MQGATVPTQVAAAGTKEHLFMGRRVFAELTGETSMTSLLFLGITGRLPEEDEVGVLDAIASTWTVADPRVWPLKVARLLASHGNALSGLGGGFLALSCRFIGPWRNLPATSRLLVEVNEATAHGEDFNEAVHALLAARRYLPGFGVPFRAEDERLAPLRRCLERTGRQAHHYFSLSERLASWVMERRQLGPNAALSVAAALLDVGVGAASQGAMGAALMVHMFFANACEGAEQRAEVLKRLPKETVRYIGKAPRLSPRAQST
ncbi:MAG: hypothetical protein JRH20_29285 [Deltaproteobacteria bacterium]|nr:hypothetical protein [Deltaproteobacteria bacterium]